MTAIRCPKCKRGKLRQKVNVFVDAPFSPRPPLGKTGLRSKEVRVDGVGWDRALVYCPRATCGWVMRYEPSNAAPASPGPGEGESK